MVARTPLVDEFRRLGRRSGVAESPAYLRVRSAIHGVIDAGHLQPGHALPSERELARLLSLSRVTVRKALSGLVDDGLLTQRQGSGTFVSDRIVRSASHLTSFSDDLRARGLDPRSRFLERGIGEVTPEEAMALNLSPGQSVVRLYRLRLGGDQPLAIERSAVPQSILRDASLVKNSLYEALERAGCKPARALQRLRAVVIEEEQAQLLDVPSGSPGLWIERRAFLEDGRVVEYTTSLYRGDRYDFVAELQNHE